MITSADIADGLGHIPLVGSVLRWYARRYEDGSVVRIARGQAAGMKWRRHHRYVNGYWTGIYEIDLQRAIARELGPGNVFYDVGANAGFFTVLAAKLVGSTGSVFSFEPMVENAKSIREQIDINSLNQCELIIKAVSDRSETASFVPAEHNALGHLSSSGAEPAGADKGLLSVQTVTLDEFALSHAPPDVIKIDVEGAETEVLAGAHSLLGSPRAPKLIIELHGEGKARGVEAILVSFGYRLTDLDGTPLAGGATSHRHVIGYPKGANEY
jgi:FkbM family methyltransferase